ncbi:cell morphogenesis protein [Patellaria atrata CBS 101060]|uniref:Cell morphogenesis protein n=1 Tax=Patellaria atrata CBS 101060 TaxID=1346257 RepID=A0A9P4S180_9PEZI|nr:cell morphogenesis protein [Patellaria atrata CBS 101060]
MFPTAAPPSRNLLHNAEHPTNPSIQTTQHSRESSMTRGRALTAGSARGNSPREQTPALGPPKIGPSPDGGGLERKASLSYGHHRQTSIVHGIQHSRNTSFVNSPSTSPLSPQIIAAAGVAASTLGPDGTMTGEDTREMSLTSPSVVSIVTSKLSSQTSTLVSDRAIVDGSIPSGQRRAERMHSGKLSRDHARSQSRHHHHQQDLKTVGEYALHHLFNSFVGQADQKINQCLAESKDIEPRVELMCGPGVDPSFDQLISALSHIARHKPKPLIDTLMFWRKAKGEAATNARNELNQSQTAINSPNGTLPRRNTEPVQAGVDSQTLPSVQTPHDILITRQNAVIQTERQSTIAIYLLCRVLMEIISQSTLASLTPEMAKRLEDIIYDKLIHTQPETLEESPLKHANWLIFSQLLGVMSTINFDKVSARFLASLKDSHIHLDAKGVGSRDIQLRAALYVRGMKHLKLPLYPDTAWEQSCEFMVSLSRLFFDVHGQIIKLAYCQLFMDLLPPVAANATSQLNTTKWKSAVEPIKTRLAQMLMKPKYWQDCFPSLALLTCVSPSDVFSSQWLQLIMPLQPKLKERSTRAVALSAICRLVWTYLYRNSEVPSVAAQKLNEVIRLVFQPGKRSYLSTEVTIAEPLVQLIRIIGFKHRDICFKHIIFPLMNSEQFSSGKDLRAENLEPERIVIGIRAFLAIMTDLEKGEEPSFPVSFTSDPYVEIFEPPAFLAPTRPVMQATTKSSTLKEERLSRPVMINGFDDIVKESYIKFCKILGEITIICDNTFGGQAVLDEKFSIQTPKTPMADAFSFARRDDFQTSQDSKQGYYDLLHVAVQALPRCLPPNINLNALVNLLCTGTAHVQSNIAASSAQSLKSIAKQSHAQIVTIGFARFIFKFDDRYATMSDGGLLGPDHIESTLNLYVELLQIWIEETKQKIKKTSDPWETDNLGNRAVQLDLTAIWNHVEEIESHGVFFLCSPSRRVRAFAVTVLRLVTEFDTALGKDNTRIIRILEGNPQNVMDIHDENLSLAERSRLQRGMRKSSVQGNLIELCSSDMLYDTALWFKVFPNLIRLTFETCPLAVTFTRDIICERLSQMHRAIEALANGPRANPYPTADLPSTNIGGRLATTAPNVVIEQWKLYLIFTCTTLTNAGGQIQSPSHTIQHNRKGSKSSQRSQDKIQSAAELFNRVLPFLSASNPSVREAVVVGLGSINANLYRPLLESLQFHVVTCNEEVKMRFGGNVHQRTASSPRRNRRTDHLRTEITHVYKLTSHFLKDPAIYENEWILTNLVNYTKDLRLFLNDVEVQNEWDFQKLRMHYCGLVEELFEGINRTKDPIRWMPFQSRKAAFALMEDWCGYSPNQSQIRAREDNMRRSFLDREQDLGKSGIVNAAIEIEKRDLRTAALSAMAALCGGPVSITTDSKVTMQFDVRRMLSWIDTIFETPSDRTHVIGRRALKNLIVHNREHPYLLGRSMEMCYLSKTPKALESYFQVVTLVLTEREDLAPPFWKTLSAGLYTLGNENNALRMKAARLLRTLEERQEKNSKLQDLDISISDKTIAVYKAAQFDMSCKLAKQHPELAFHVFSEFSYYFKELQPDHQRNMVVVMLPWIQTIELQLDPNGGPTASSYMLLVNLFEITVRSGTVLHNEIQALWKALATGGHAGNVQLVLDFIISLCLDKREQNFVDYAKQIVVHLSATPAGTKVVEFLLMQITPKAMVLEKREPPLVPQDNSSLPYLADLGSVLPIGAKQAGFSLGQLCLVLLVDLIVSPMQSGKQNVPLLLQVVLILWDHYIPIVQDHAREMLVHLIHELVISKIENGSTTPDKKSIEDFIDLVRRHDARVVWAYDDYNGKDDDDSTSRVPETMIYVATEVCRIFCVTHAGIREEWGKATLHWATSCPVRHLACRSFQLFRCISSSLDQNMLGDMLARLSNTIADEESDIQTFSMEILTTLKTVIAALEPKDLIQFPQLFWTTCACLETIHEREFMESLSMLDKLLDKLDLSDPCVIRILKESYPSRWEGTFEGLQTLVYNGVRSDVSVDRTLRILERLVVLPSNELIGDDSRLVFTIFAHFPRFLRCFETDSEEYGAFTTAEILAQVSESQGKESLCRALRNFALRRYRVDRDFLLQMVHAVHESFFPDLEYKSLIFLLGLLTNRLPWFKIKTMQLLCVVIPDIDMRKPEITSKGPDLISPLLRLLQTEFCPQALRVLDNVLNLSATPTPLDRHHLRMSMAGSHSTRAFRKEYERTQSLYGIPEASGWSIPMPAIHSSMTRQNVHAVFYTCATPDAISMEDVATPKIEFKTEDDQFGNYFPDYRTTTMTSDDTRGDGHMGELAMKLDSLDDFFNDDITTDTLTLQSSPDLTQFPLGSGDARETLYDQQTLPILHKSLTRNVSVTSFQSGFADIKPSRDPGVMTPTAFTAATKMTLPPIPTAPISSASASRPGMHSRSVTSPAVNQRGSPSSVFADDEPFSDDDVQGSRPPPQEKPFSLENMIRPLAQGTRSGFRSSMRRLTGGGGDARENGKTREAIRLALQKSPQVPKVPDMYLQNPKSADP